MIGRRQTATYPVAGGVSARSLALFAWGALALILWQELSGTPTPLLLLLAQPLALLALLLAARRLPALRPLGSMLLWLLALSVGWHLVFGILDAIPAWEAWQQSVPWVVRGAVVQALIFVPSLLLVLLGVGRGSRQALRLTWGDGAAVASPDSLTLGRRPSWRRLGPDTQKNVRRERAAAVESRSPP